MNTGNADGYRQGGPMDLEDAEMVDRCLFHIYAFFQHDIDE